MEGNYECWNCGKVYNFNKNEVCPKCGNHPDDEPCEDELEDYDIDDEDTFD